MASSQSIIGGIGYARIVSDLGTFDNIRLASEPTYKLTVGENTAVAGRGITVDESNSYIELEIYDGCGFNPTELSGLCNAVVTYREVFGRSQTWRQADVVGAVEKSGGTWTIRFESILAAQVAGVAC